MLDGVFAELSQRFENKKYGIEISIGAEEFLSSLCFADDVLMLAATQQQARVMLHDLSEAASSAGLTIHPEKTQIMTSRSTDLDKIRIGK